nr:MAG TPA: hypothetical protein [Caudoviricetes sp.]
MRQSENSIKTETEPCYSRLGFLLVRPIDGNCIFIAENRG